MIITITLHAPTLLQKPKQILKLPNNTTIYTLLQNLQDTQNPGNPLIDPQTQTPSPNIITLINDTQTTLLDGPQTKLKDKDRITILSLVHGGKHPKCTYTHDYKYGQKRNSDENDTEQSSD